MVPLGPVPLREMADVTVLLSYGPFTELVRTFTGDDVFARLRLATSAATLGPYLANWLYDAFYWFEMWTDYEVDLQIREQEDRDIAIFIRDHVIHTGFSRDDWY